MEIDSHVDAQNDVEMAAANDEQQLDDNEEEDDNGGVGVKKERNALTRLPIAKVKHIFKLDWDNKVCQKNSYVLIAKMTELFLSELAKNVHAVCKRSKRKTMNIEDVASVIKQHESKYGFVDVASLFYVDVFNNKKSKSVNTRNAHDGTATISNSNSALHSSSKNARNKPHTATAGARKQQSRTAVSTNRTIESMFHMK